MARLTRKNIKVFAGSASNNGIFGSLQANDPTLTNDVEDIQSLNAWEEGWNAATETSEELPPLEEIQAVEYVTTYQQAYIMQEGLPEWAATVTYYKGSLTKKVTTTGFQIYCSLTDNNINHALTDTTNWKMVMDSDDLYAYDSAVVHKTGNETIAGTKTFSSSPVVPTPTSTDNSTKAATTAFVKNQGYALDSDVVHKSGTETVAGLKTFSSPVAQSGVSNNSFVKSNPDLTKGTTPSSTFNMRSGLFENTTSFDLSNELAGIILAYQDDGSTRAGIAAFQPVAGSDTGASIDVYYNADGTIVTHAPTCSEPYSIVNTVAKSQTNNGYYKLGNGLIIQWGVASASATMNVTLPTAFTSSSYKVAANTLYNGGELYALGVTGKTTTGFTLRAYGGAAARDANWIAIGY